MFFECFHVLVFSIVILFDQAGHEKFLKSIFSFHDPGRLGADHLLVFLHHRMRLFHIGQFLKLLSDHPRLFHLIQLRLLNLELRSPPGSTGLETKSRISLHGYRRQEDG
jgi:hypothetical protein